MKSVLAYRETLCVADGKSSLMTAEERSFYNHPSWQCWSRAAASHEHTGLLLTHTAFQKIYLKPHSTAKRGKGKRRKMDTIMLDIKTALNT